MKKKVVSISDLDVQLISDEDLQALAAQGAADNTTSAECCDNSGTIIVTGC
jgi:hypothetical protein